MPRQPTFSEVEVFEAGVVLLPTRTMRWIIEREIENGLDLIGKAWVVLVLAAESWLIGAFVRKTGVVGLSRIAL